MILLIYSPDQVQLLEKQRDRSRIGLTFAAWMAII